MNHSSRIVVAAFTALLAGHVMAQAPAAEFKPPAETSIPAGPIGVAIQEGANC